MQIENCLELVKEAAHAFDLHGYGLRSDEPVAHVVSFRNFLAAPTEADRLRWKREDELQKVAEVEAAIREDSYRAELAAFGTTESLLPPGGRLHGPNIYQLKRREWGRHIYPVVGKVMVRAWTERRARLLVAVSDSLDEDGDELWVDERRSSCERIGIATVVNERILSVEESD